MKTTQYSLTAVLLVLAVAFISPMIIVAQTSSAPTPSSRSIAMPAPPYEDIVQFNSLRITEIVSSSIITAVSDLEIQTPCLRFERENVPRGTAFPCPMPLSQAKPEMPAVEPYERPVISYTIRISPQTILFLRDRTPATITDFQRGDRMNVYGFYDAEAGGVEALILRNLSKPKEQRFVQLNSLEVVSAPSSPAAPATLAVVQRTIYPCLNYGPSGTGAAEKFPCPAGLPSFSAAAPQLKALDESRIPPSLARKYLIEVTAKTILLARTRTPLSLGDIAVGDVLNVYGHLREDNATIEALILRDLSRPPQAETLTATVSAVSADGSFTIRLDDGQEFTVKPGLQAGMRVEVRGLVDRVHRIISDIFHIRVIKPEVIPLNERQ